MHKGPTAELRKNVPHGSSPSIGRMGEDGQEPLCSVHLPIISSQKFSPPSSPCRFCLVREDSCFFYGKKQKNVCAGGLKYSNRRQY